MARDEFKRDLGVEKKKVAVSTFKGQVLVNVREWYQKDGTWKPGNKGIALTKDQWRVLCELRDEIDAEIASLETDACEEPSSKKQKREKVKEEEETA